ncbi:MAG: PAS domain-containing protein, partial [Actinomycetota bacterium]
MDINDDEHYSLEKLHKLAIEKADFETLAAKNSLSVKKTKDLLHELRVHQFELEIQNEELKHSQIALEVSRKKYFKLYDIAPAGYCTLSGTGLVIEANLKACELFGLDRIYLKRQLFSSFIFKDDLHIYYQAVRNLSKTGDSQTCEVRFMRRNRTSLWVLLDISSMQDEDDVILYLVAVSDISGRKRTEIELQRERERLSNILEATNAGNWEWNVQTGETVFNDRWAEIIGYTLKEISPLSIKAWKKFIHPEDLVESNKQLDRVFNRESEYYDIEYRMKHKDGSWIWIQSRGKIISWISHRNPLLMTGTHTNITVRKKVEEELSNSRKELDLVLKSVHVGIWKLDLVENKRIFDNQACILLGIDPVSFGGTAEEFYAVVHPDDRDKIKTALSATINQGILYEQDYRTVWQDGSIHHITSRAELHRASDGSRKTINGIIWDITDRKKAEEALIMTNRRQEMANNAGGVGIWNLDLVTNELTWNDQMFALYGITREQFSSVYQAWVSVLHPEDAERGNTEIQMAISGEKEFDTEFRIIWPDGTIRHISARALVRRDDAGKPVEMMGTNYDSTDQKKREEEILHLSYHDILTGLYNRRFFEEEIKRLDTERQLPLSIIMGDLNSLKLINDTFGHLEGDRLLTETAKLLKKVCRSDDILARWGGDEFVILLPKTSIASAEEIVQRIKKECSELFIQNIPIGLAIGIAAKTEHEQNIEDIILEAESNMYKNKLAGKQSSAGSVISALEQALYEKSNETMEHTQRLKELSLKLGKKLKLHPHQIDELSLLASLHDIGKVAVPETILLKEGALSENEWKIIKRHPEIGYNIAQSSPQIAHIARLILSCHENWDGSGYPAGLAKEKIPLLSRIVAIADSYDVMTSKRTYKDAMNSDDAAKELRRCAGTQFDPALIEKFIEVLAE